MTEQKQEIIRDLGNGLIMRRSTREDVERLARFNARIHGEDEYDARAVAAWTRDLLTLSHPTFAENDFIMIEDTASGEIISALCLISQTWAYGGISFGVGRPELVGTDPKYRGRGLVRAQFDVIHEWSRQRGEMVQVITGIPYFYRQFGYEMGLDLSGGRIGYEPQVPQLAEGEQEPYHIRRAEAADLPWVMKMYERDIRRSLVSAVWDEALFRHEILDKSPENVNRQVVCIIETPDRQPVGYLAHPGFVWGRMMVLTMYGLDDGISYLSVTPSVIRYIWQIGQTLAQERERVLNAFGFWLGGQHPAYQAAARYLTVERKPYAYYVRVADLPAFLRRIAPVLEQRLRESPCAGHTGEIKISFYRDGLRLVFDHGCLVTSEPWKPTIHDDEGSAAYPNLTFLQLVFGYRSVNEIRHAYADNWMNEEAEVLLNVLFPKQHSDIWPIS